MFRATLLVSLVLLVPALLGDRPECQGHAPERHASVSQSAAAPDRYFVVVFSYQDAENHVQKSHTFATFVKASNLDDTADNARQARFETRTISWLPAKFADTLRLSFFPTAGKNFTLGETLRFAERLDVQVRHWGPLEIDARLYEQAARRSEQLASGAVRYQVYDSSKPRTKRAADVVHCIDAVAEPAGKLTLGTVRGFAAGEQVVAHFRAHARQTRTPAWLYDAVVRAADATPPETLLARAARDGAPHDE